MNRQNLKELFKARKAIRQKYLTLKSDIAQTQSQLEKSFKPISEPLQKLLQTVEPIKAESKIKGESISTHLTKKEIPQSSPYSYSKKEEQKPFERYLPLTSLSFLDDTYSTIPTNLTETETFDTSLDNTVIENDDDLEQTRQEILNITQTPFYVDYLQTFDPLPRTFIDESIRGDEEKFDRYYGLKHDNKTNFFVLGKTPVQIVGPDIQLQGLTYKGTPGLYELLFKKVPIGYKDSDLEQYMDILKRTNAYRRNFEPDAQIQGSQSAKYRNVIRPYLIEHNILKDVGLPSTIFSKPKPPGRRPRKPLKFGGIVKLTSNPIDYIYYDNLNELVDRLRLLVASTASGNNSHYLEINSIIEELKEAKVIK